MTARIGMVGLGIMGSAMSANLLDAGFEVVGYDVVAEKVSTLAARGGEGAGSVGEVATASDAVVVSLAKPEAIVEVADELAAAAHDGLVVADTSTMPLDVKQRAREALAAAGVELLDCTLSGTGRQAEERDLALYGSGDETAFERCRDAFDAIARSVYYLGEFGLGSKMKFVANLLVAIHNLSTAEAFVLAERAGLDARTVLEVISDGAGSSRILEIRGPMMVEGDYERPSARISMFMKDLDIIGRYAAEVGAPTPLFSASLPFYAAAMAQGRGDQDAAALCAVLEELAALGRDPGREDTS